MLSSFLTLAMAPGEGGGGNYFFLMLGAIFMIWWFLVIGPQRKQQREHDQRLKSLKKGDKVITAGGIHATVAGVQEEENVLILQIADNTKIRINRNSISTVISADKPEKADKSEKSKGAKKDE